MSWLGFSFGMYVFLSLFSYVFICLVCFVRSLFMYVCLYVVFQFLRYLFR